VLVEKPVAMTADEAKRLIAVRDRSGKLIIEGFMVRYAAPWIEIMKLIASGRIGAVSGVQAHATYVNVDPNNIRNLVDMGGGALMDIGCYVILFARMIFGSEPRRIVSLIDRDPVMKTDRRSSMILDFPQGQATLFRLNSACTRSACSHLRNEGFDRDRDSDQYPDDQPRALRLTTDATASAVARKSWNFRRLTSSPFKAKPCHE
jgi:predicted dehydrogenase